jgi:DNA-binding MarR family transcriptional regulator
MHEESLMKEFKVADPDYDLWLLLARTHYRVKQARTRELHKYGISPEQAGILYYVSASGNHAMPTEIARWMMREPQTITSIIDRMLKKGLLHKTADKERRNVVRISLTEKGKRAFEFTDKRESFHKVMGGLSAEKRRLLHEVLTEMRETAKSISHLDGPGEE